MTSTGYVLKEDNGRDVKCEFIYNNMSYLTLGKKINFLCKNYIKRKSFFKITLHEIMWLKGNQTEVQVTFC